MSVLWPPDRQRIAKRTALSLLALLLWPSGGADAQTFSSPGAWSYTILAGVTLVEVRISGGGGGGGGASGFSGPVGGNGGNGQLIIAEITVAPGQVLSGTIGAGGGTGYLTGATGFGLVPCAGDGAGGSGAGAGGNGGKTNCTGTGASGGGGGGGGGYIGGLAGTSTFDFAVAGGGTAGASCYGTSAAIQYTAISASGAAGSAGAGGSVIAPGGQAAGGYVSISTAAISVTKSTQPVSNPINGTTNPKLIPGATVQYCLTLSNSWSRSATSVTLTDSIPAQATYVAGSALSGVDCTSAASAATGLSYSAPVLSLSGFTLNPGSTYALTFLVTVN